MTIQEQLDIGLTVLGWVRDTTDRSKFHAFTHKDRPGHKYFTGSHGAFRAGRCASKSFDLSGSTTQVNVLRAFEAATNQVKS